MTVLYVRNLDSIDALQRSRGCVPRMTTTSSTSARSPTCPSTEPGLCAPDDRSVIAHPEQRVLPSTEPGLCAPDDLPQGAGAGAVAQPSTEPGLCAPDDAAEGGAKIAASLPSTEPGLCATDDLKSPADWALNRALLQRSRGCVPRMTTRPSRPSSTPMILQRSRGCVPRMTPCYAREPALQVLPSTEPGLCAPDDP